MTVTQPIPTVNLDALAAFSAIASKLYALEDKKGNQEGIEGVAKKEVLVKIAVYHLSLTYALLLKAITSDDTFTGDLDTWKENTGYAQLQQCAANHGIDLGAIISNTI